MLVLGLLRAATVPPSAYAPVVLVAALFATSLRRVDHLTQEELGPKQEAAA